MKPNKDLRNMPQKIKKKKHSGQLHECASTIQFMRIVKACYLFVEKGIEKMTVQKLQWFSSLPLFQQFKVHIYYLQRQGTRSLDFTVQQFQTTIIARYQLLLFHSIQQRLNKQ